MTVRTCARGLAFAISLMALPAVAQNFAPVAIVNDQVITGYDVEQRALLNSIAAGGAPTNSVAALDDLIADALRLQAARRAGIDPTPAEVRTGFDEISRLNQRDPNQMRSGLTSRGVSNEALDSQIKAEVAWRQLIVQRYGSRARVTDNDVNKVVGPDSGAQAGEAEYLLAEMRFPIAEGGEAAARAKGQQVLRELTSGGRFSAVARANSKGPTALAGGDLGWVPRSKLSAQAAPVVGVMNVDRVSTPFVDGGDIVILGLRGTREAGGGELRTCADVEPRKAQYLPISGNLGDLNLATMPGPVREAVSGLNVGDITPPVRSNDGFHVIVVCDKKSSGPTGEARRAAAGGELRAQRLDRYARSLLRELKREAVIERR